MRVKFEIRPDVGTQQARFTIGLEKFTLKVGEYSDWTTVEFKAGLGFTAHGICRFYLKELSPEVEVYVSPVNIDPGHPDLPISHPATYSIYLAKLYGPYATLGLAEDTWALNEHVLDDDAFLAQCYSNHEDRERMLFDALEKTQQGLCTCVFDTTDRVQHMFWRYLDEDHPAARDIAQGDKRPQVIPELYQRMDRLIGRVMEQIDDKTLLLVISDHGFKSFARCMNLNAWLHQNGYLTLKDGKTESGDWFEDVDWSRTRAYTMGLNGLYLNIKGREKQGIVDPADAEVLKTEIQQKLNGLKDPDSGVVGITGVFITGNVYRGPYSENAPDLLVGYGAGYRASWDSVMGKVTSQIFEDNLKAWSGDHCIDPRLVPGVLFSSHKFVEDKPHIADVAPTILSLFGLPLPMHFDGKAWNLAG